MPEPSSLLEALPKEWRAEIEKAGGALEIGRGLVFGELTYATLDELEPARAHWLPLFGDEIGVEFVDSAEGWNAAFWVNSEAFRAGDNEEEWPELDVAEDEGGVVQLRLNQRSVSTLGARLATTVDESGRLEILLRPTDALGQSPLPQLRAVAPEADTANLTLTVRVMGASELDGKMATVELPVEETQALVVSFTQILRADQEVLVAEPDGLLLPEALADAEVKPASQELRALATLDGEAAFTIEVKRHESTDEAIDFGVMIRARDADLVLEGTLRVGKDLRVTLGSAQTTLVLNEDVVLGADGPLTCILSKGTEIEVVIGSAEWRLQLPQANARAAVLIAPGVPEEVAKAVWDEEGVNEVLQKRLVVDLDSEEDRPALVMSSARGVSLDAQVRPRSLEVGGLSDVAVSEGRLIMRDYAWQLSARAGAAIPWFEGGRGSLRIQGQGQGSKPGEFGASFEVETLEGWTDPSGVLSVRNPSLDVSLRWDGSEWAVDGGIGGELVLHRAPFVDRAGEWLDQLFDDVTLAFERISLDKLKALVKGEETAGGGTSGEGAFGIFVRLRGRALDVRLWNVFECNLSGFTLLPKGEIGFDGSVAFTIGDVRFGGAFTNLRVSLRGERIHLSADPSFDGMLEAPGGVRARMGFHRESGPDFDVLDGKGSLKAPGMPDVSVHLRVGRFRSGGEWLPTLVLFGAGPVTVSLLPGVVVRHVGVGFGVYQALSGADIRDADEAFKLLSSGKFPNPGLGEGWVRDEDTQLSLVGQVTIGASTAPPSEPDLYAANLVVSLDSQARLAAFGALWALTSPDDARTVEFHKRPLARGVVVLNAAGPTLVAAFETRRDPVMSVDKKGGVAADALRQVLGAVQTRASLEARPGLFALTLGPTRGAMQIGMVGVKGSTLFAVRASETESVALATVAMSAEARLEGVFRFGKATVKIKTEAGFGFEATLFGQIRRGHLLLAADFRAEAYVRLSVSVTIKFKKRIGPVKITIKLRGSFKVSVEAVVRAGLALSTDRDGVGVKGTAHVRFRVMGVRVSAGLPVNYNPELVGEARKAMRAARSHILLPAST